MQCAKDTCPVQKCVIVQPSFSAVYKNFKIEKILLAIYPDGVYNGARKEER